MEFGKRHDTTDTTDFCPRELVTNLLQACRFCCGLSVGIAGGLGVQPPVHFFFWFIRLSWGVRK